MTLTVEQSSHKDEYESLATNEVIKRIRTAMGEGCIRPCHVYDLVDEALHRLAKIEALVKSVDLTKCSPLPWKSQLHSYPIADTGDYDGTCDATDAMGKSIVAKFDDNYREEEMEDGDRQRPNPEGLGL